ncbi:MAG: amidase family protein, partial [Chloroflexota bacterium]|nr:amidase family protein [Chloroflexota bacterium]
TAVLESQKSIFTDLGCGVAEGEPDFSEADEIFKVWRAWSFAVGYADLVQTQRDQIKGTVVWNVEEGLKLTGPQLGQAEVKRTALYHRVREFMQEYEFLVLPVSQVPPFAVGQPYVTQINGMPMDTYIDWMQSCYFITVTGLPAISVPCGFTPEGLPVGIQIVGRHQDDWGVLQLAYAFEQATQTGQQRPALAQ